MQKVLIAGGAGFIGSHLCKSFLSDSLGVICVDSLITGDEKNIKPFITNPNFKFLRYDITQPLQDKELSELDYIFNLASPASPNKKSQRSYINYPIETLLANSDGTHYLLELAKINSAKFLYVSSSEVYGDPELSPQPETYFGNVNPNGIRSVYDEGKRFGEAITMAYVRKFNIDARIIRIFNTYGPKMQKDDGRVVSNFINQAIEGKPLTVYGDGSQTRSFCYVDDMINGLKLAMLTLNTKGEVINLGNPDERTILELAKTIKQMTNSSSKIEFKELPEDDPKVRRPDIEKAKRLLKWSPNINLEHGLKKTIEYFKKL
ncbi:MAG: SDR family oxidoreductase [Patescibacteria group bacterium]|nr:SDR family oxidoreductase [Patescibacteria group bacterium]